MASTLGEALAKTLPTVRWLAVEDTLPQEASEEGPPCEYDAPEEWEEWAQPHDLCHVIFTSGSTGRPKGVQVYASLPPSAYRIASDPAPIPGLGARIITLARNQAASASLGCDIILFTDSLWRLSGGFTKMQLGPSCCVQRGFRLAAYWSQSSSSSGRCPTWNLSA